MSGRGVSTGTISATGITTLPLPMADRVSSYTIHFQSVSFSGSVTIKGAAPGQGHTALGVAYKNMQTGLNATAAITGNALVLVDAAGIELTLDATVTSGSLKWAATPMMG